MTHATILTIPVSQRRSWISLLERKQEIWSNGNAHLCLPGQNRIRFRVTSELWYIISLRTANNLFWMMVTATHSEIGMRKRPLWEWFFFESFLLFVLQVCRDVLSFSLSGSHVSLTDSQALSFFANRALTLTITNLFCSFIGRGSEGRKDRERDRTSIAILESRCDKTDNLEDCVNNSDWQTQIDPILSRSIFLNVPIFTVHRWVSPMCFIGHLRDSWTISKCDKSLDVKNRKLLEWRVKLPVAFYDTIIHNRSFLSIFEIIPFSLRNCLFSHSPPFRRNVRSSNSPSDE
jgi:hypothetical protein